MDALIEQITIPDSKLAREITELAKRELSPLLFDHSSRVFEFGALSGLRKGLKFEAELLYAGAMFHDFGLMPKFSSDQERFEVDGANEARSFLRQHHIREEEVDEVWTAIALHTTPGIPGHMSPVIALVTAGVEMDVLGIAYEDFNAVARERVIEQFPRTEHFKEDIINAFYNGVKHKPHTTFGNVKADVIKAKDPAFVPGNFCQTIRQSQWPS